MKRYTAYNPIVENILFGTIEVIRVVDDVTVFSMELAILYLRHFMDIRVLDEPDLSKALAIINHLRLGRQLVIAVQETGIKVSHDCLGDFVDRVRFAETFLLILVYPAIEQGSEFDRLTAVDDTGDLYRVLLAFIVAFRLQETLLKKQK